jgi:hypothetical protein
MLISFSASMQPQIKWLRRRSASNQVAGSQLLRLQDDEETWETESFDELRTRLRNKYPDAAFERTLHYERDHEAEERHERALNGLISILAKAAVDDFIAEQSRAEAEPDAKQS